MIDGLAKEGKDGDETWAVLYKRACDGLVSDLTKELNNKFNTELKLVARETSSFKDGVNSATGLSGIKISFDLPKYAAIHIISIDVKSEAEYASPEVPFYVYETDGDGELLYEGGSALIVGRNTVYVDRDFFVNEIFVAYDPEVAILRETENKRYNSTYFQFTCDECRFDCGGYEGKVVQVNGGGLNVKYIVYCSINKFVCENIRLFAQSLLWRIGIVVSHERRYGERLNKFTTMQLERAEELIGFYTEEYEKEMKESIKAQNIREDPYCFPCKHLVSKRSSTP
jgi:hypothetical protein